MRPPGQLQRHRLRETAPKLERLGRARDRPRRCGKQGWVRRREVQLVNVLTGWQGA